MRFEKWKIEHRSIWRGLVFRAMSLDLDKWTTVLWSASLKFLRNNSHVYKFYFVNKWQDKKRYESNRERFYQYIDVIRVVAKIHSKLHSLLPRCQCDPSFFSHLLRSVTIEKKHQLLLPLKLLGSLTMKNFYRLFILTLLITEMPPIQY